MSSNCTPATLRAQKAKRIVKEIYVYIILLAVVTVLSLLKGELFQRGNFLFPPNIANLLRMSVPILMISSAFTLIFITGNMDLSVGSTLSLTTVVHSDPRAQWVSVCALAHDRDRAGRLPWVHQRLSSS